MKHTKQELKRGRIATSVVYFMLGSMGGAWLGRIPDVQRHLGLSNGVLGTVLLVGAFGGLAAMQLATVLMRRFGQRRSLGVLATLYPFTMLGIPLAHDAVTLSAALVLSSGTGSLVGILANTHAADVEVAYERAIMSSFHAMFSVGGLVGAGVAGFLAGRHVPVLLSIGGAAIFHFVLVVLCVSWLLKLADANLRQFDASVDHLAHHHHRRSWWRGVLLVGSLTFVSYMAEGSVADWSAIFMREHRDAAPTLAVAAFVAFSACMTLGRLSGDWLTMRFGKVAMIRSGAALAATGLFAGLFIPSKIVTIVGFALVGCGLSVLVPLLFSIAGSLRGGESHAAIARVGTIAFFGLLVGPACIGAVAQHSSLVVALLIPAVLLLYVVIASSTILHRVVKPQADV